MKPQMTKLKITFYKEGEQFISYCPALDLSTAGDTFEEAKKNFEEAVAIFFEETIRRGTLEDVLLGCGWEKINRPKLRWKPPVRRFITEIEEEISSRYWIEILDRELDRELDGIGSKKHLTKFRFSGILTLHCSK